MSQSGTKDNRPDLEKLTISVRAKLFDEVIVTRLTEWLGH
jgi:DNA invertase Pin-like site-specific DNA recombinase